MDIRLILFITYIAGFLITWVVSFRMMITSDTYSNNRYNPGEIIVTILISGALSFLISLVWPIVTAIFAMFMWFVKPYMMKRNK